MTPAEKRVLIDQLSRRMGWLIKSLTKAGFDFFASGGDYVSIVSVGGFDAFEREGDHDPRVFLDEAYDERVWPRCNSQLNELVGLLGFDKCDFASLRYEFADQRLELEIGNNPYDMAEIDSIIDALLDMVSEQHIRDGFADQERTFFEFTRTTPADWHVSE